MKKVIAVLLTVCFLSLGMTMAVLADEGAAISAATVECLPGTQDVAVAITVDKNAGLAGFYLKIAFDKTKVTPDRIVYNNEVFDGSNPTSNLRKGVNKETLDYITIVNASTDVELVGQIATLYFDVKEGLDLGTEIPLVLSTNPSQNIDIDEQPVPVSLTSGKITVKGEITGYTFEDAEPEAYNGEAKTIEVTNLPDGVTAAYTYEKLNETTGGYEAVASCVDVGAYIVTAHMTGANYFAKDDTATLTITPAEISGYELQDTEVDYDSETHSIEVSEGAGATSDVEISYSYEKLIDPDTNEYEPLPEGVVPSEPGIYRQTLTMRKANYAPRTITATLTINPLEIEGYTFEDKTVPYDETLKTIAVTAAEGATEDVEITYTYTSTGEPFEGATEVGEYEVTATITKDTYFEKELTATLKIEPGTITGYTFNGGEPVVYNGESHTIAVTAGEGAVSGVSIAYTIGDEVFRGAVNAGTYHVKATITKSGYNDLPLEADLIVTPAPGEQNPAYIASATFPYTHEVASVEGNEKASDIDLDGTGFEFIGDDVALELGDNTVHVKYTSADPNYLDVEDAEKVVTLRSRNILDVYDLRLDGDTSQWYEANNVVDANKEVIGFTSVAKTMTGVKYYIDDVAQAALPEGVTAQYSLDGENYTDSLVIYEGGTYTGYAKISADGYDDIVLSATFRLNYRVGDMNTDNKLTALDGTWMLRYIAEWGIGHTATQLKAASRTAEDFDEITTADVLRLLKFTSEWDDIEFGPAD